MRVVHCKREDYTHYIGRPSTLGNPFTIGKDGTREEVIAKFERWAWHSSEVMETIERLPEDAVLGCWCKPQPCHGDVIVKLWGELHHNEPALTAEWSGGLCDITPDACWIDDATGEHVDATTGKRSTHHPSEGEDDLH